MDEAIATVVTVTGSKPELAAQYLQLADGDASNAIQLYFDNGGADLAGPSHTTITQPPPAPSHSHPRVSGAGNPEDPITLPDDNEVEDISDDNDPEVTGYRKSSRSAPDAGKRESAGAEDDEAMARRLQEEMYQDQDPSILRAPIARQAETLVGPGASTMPLAAADLHADVEERLQAFQRRRTHGRHRSFDHDFGG